MFPLGSRLPEIDATTDGLATPRWPGTTQPMTDYLNARLLASSPDLVDLLATLDVEEDEDGYTLLLSLAECDPDDLAIDIADGILTVSLGGTTDEDDIDPALADDEEDEEEDEGNEDETTEEYALSFSCTVPPSIELAAISADLDDETLYIRLPKRIPILAEAEEPDDVGRLRTATPGANGRIHVSAPDSAEQARADGMAEPG